MVAKSPKATRYIEVLQAMSLPPSPAPIATGWSDSCRAGFAPAVGQRRQGAQVDWVKKANAAGLDGKASLADLRQTVKKYE